MSPPTTDGAGVAGGGHEVCEGLVIGRVQGVGFRPFVVRLADELGVSGWVRNTNDGVVIRAEGPPECLDRFRIRLQADLPPAAEILRIAWQPAESTGRGGFTILESTTRGEGESSARMGRVLITPDLALCARCLAEFVDLKDRRQGFALSSCTDCGPRFSIQDSAPFDRERTTMSDFPPCELCLAEYRDIRNRRFHAQNIACPRCGPRIWLVTGGEVPASPTRPDELRGDDRDVLDRAAEKLRDGSILAVKGIGGFHLVCDATRPEVVARLRDLKRRDRKPFAVMFQDEAQVAEHATLDGASREALLSAAAPIVLIPRRPGSGLAAGIAPGLSTIGAFLAYTPLHQALLRGVGHPLVATSANPTDEPMPTANDVALADLRKTADAFLLHDRRILRHADDSVTRVIGRRAVPIRIGRGLAPVRIELPFEVPPLLATGGHLKAAVALTRGRELFLGQHVGDLDTPGARRRYLEHVEDLPRLLGVRPTAVIHDAHPDYFSTRYAAQAGLPTIAIQHHHAHVMACLAEHGERGPALGIAWDGTGYGDDGTIWGGEFLVVDGPACRRIGSLWPFPLVGGDRAAREPRRSAVGVCFAAGEPPPADTGFTDAESRLLRSALNSPRVAIATSSVGRLFDAWSSLLGRLQISAYEAQAAMELEELADRQERGAFEVELIGTTDGLASPIRRLDWRPWVAETRRLLARGTRVETIAAYFHNALAIGSLRMARHAGIETVVLSGGCFQNALLAVRTASCLEGAGFRVLTHRRVPPGDGGLAAGQIWAAALRPWEGPPQESSP